MKFLGCKMTCFDGLPLVLLMLLVASQLVVPLEGAAFVICGKESAGVEKSASDTMEEQYTSTLQPTTTTRRSEVKQFLRRVQLTLEKAEPWVDELEKEAKRLEETAKRFGEGVIKSLRGIMDKLVGGGGSPTQRPDTGLVTDKQPDSSVLTSTEVPASVMQIEIETTKKTPTIVTTQGPEEIFNIEDVNTMDNEI